MIACQLLLLLFSPFPGQQYLEGQAVYPDQDTELTGVFPDGTPFTSSQKKKTRYVFVWKTWGKDNLFHNNNNLGRSFIL